MANPNITLVVSLRWHVLFVVLMALRLHRLACALCVTTVVGEDGAAARERAKAETERRLRARRTLIP